ncbi:MAG: DUF4962 domain-containing protein [Phycisphaeraceae bacterium JB051]
MLRQLTFSLLTCCFVLCSTTLASAQTHLNFDTSSDIESVQRVGQPTLDQQQFHGDKGQSVKLAAGDELIIPVKMDNGQGSVSFWVYDDASASAHPKRRQAGPLWGVRDSQGNHVLVGAIYAPYLSGEKTYAAGSVNRKLKRQPWQQVQYLGINRQAKWRQWTMRFDQDGLSILCDGKNVNAKRSRFNAAKVTLKGISHIVFLGDQTPDKNTVIWIDDVRFDIKQAQASAQSDEQALKFLPTTDPKLDGLPVKVNAQVMVTRPRLLFGQDDIQTFRQTFNDPNNRILRDGMVHYLPSCKVPDHRRFLTDGTDAQRHAYWRLPNVTLHYLITGEQQSLAKAVDYIRFFANLKHWETTYEIDSGMSAAHIMMGMAFAFDSLYNELEPTLRDQVQAKLWHHARAMYYGGHLRKNPGPHYWQNDPHNNHHWHRTAGALMAALAAYDGSVEQQWLLKQITDDVAWLARWLPKDGTSHESPTYLIFGTTQLTLMMQASDRCLDTHYLDLPFFKHFGEFLMYCQLPGTHKLIDYGDSGGGFSAYSLAIYQAATKHQQAGIQKQLDQTIKTYPRSFEPSWFGIFWRGQTLSSDLSLERDQAKLFDDVGIALMRDGWEKGDVAGMFKCGPFGGYTLNEFRNQNEFCYINVAHDDPDANSFVIFKDGDYLAQTDRYSKHKQSQNHNTILINGMGQRVPGRRDNVVWTQPAVGDIDMSDMAYITAWQQTDDVIAVEGEAAGSYLEIDDPKTYESRPALQRYRRSLFWVKGQYVLVLDHIQAPKPVNITWLMQGNDLLANDANHFEYTLSHKNASCAFAVAPLSHAGWKQQIVNATADHKGKLLGYRQLQLTKYASEVYLASVYFPWGGKGQIQLKKQDGKQLITVTHDQLIDQWQWQSAADNATRSTILGTRQGKVLIHMKPE